MQCVRKQGCFERSIKADAFFLLLNFLAELKIQFLSRMEIPFQNFRSLFNFSLRASVPKCILESEKFEQNTLIVLDNFIQ